jgi:hypothetical protein
MTVHPGVAVRRRGGRFYVGLALAVALTVFAGFAPTYYLRLRYSPDSPLPGMLHLHGLVFTAWILLFLAQSTLVAAGRTDLHRRLGAAGLLASGTDLWMRLAGWLTG